MNFKRLTALILLIMMLLTMFTGCKSAVDSEEGAVADTVVEGEKQEVSTDSPEKVEGNNTNTEPDNSTTPDQSGNGNEEPDAPTSNDQTTEPDNNTEPDNGGETTEPDNGGETTEPDNGGETTEPGNSGESDGSDPNLEGVDEGNFIKIIAYNIRCANDGVHETNGYSNNISDRAPRFKALVDELNADILALSEASKEWIEYLQKNIEGTKYKMLYKYRAEDSLEAQPLLYDYNKFELLDDGYFWLSETPDIPSKGWGGKHYRGVTWAHLKVKATGRQFLYYSTHLTGSDTAVIGSCNLIVDHATKRGGFTKLPVFVSGDFNTEPWSPGYSEFATYFNDFNDYIGFDQTYTNGGYVANGGNHIIDYVFGSQEYVVPTHYEVLHRMYLGGYISDHKGIYAECYIK